MISDNEQRGGMVCKVKTNELQILVNLLSATASKMNVKVNKIRSKLLKCYVLQGLQYLFLIFFNRLISVGINVKHKMATPDDNSSNIVHSLYP